MEFHKGNSIMLVILTYFIAIVIGLHIQQGDDPESRCLASVDPKKENRIWDSYVNTYRGSDYYAVAYREGDAEDQVNEYKEVAKSCTVTAWAILHFILYFILGFLTPKFYWPLFIVGIGWELYEGLILRCHCVLDVAWNLAGLTAGVAFRRAIWG